MVLTLQTSRKGLRDPRGSMDHILRIAVLGLKPESDKTEQNKNSNYLGTKRKVLMVTL